MKNLLELHADASDEVSLLDDSEVVQYVVGDVSDCSRLGLCCCLVFQRVTECMLLLPTFIGCLATLVSCLWQRQALPLASRCLPPTGRGRLGLRLSIRPLTRLVLTSDEFFVYVAAL